MRIRDLAAAAGLAALSLAISDVAFAACTRLAFSVNDYGKVGPTNDAKNLLDKYIAKWTSDRGIKGYSVGPKSVTCELFLDVIVFDEYTCKAEASVCWPGAAPKAVKGASATSAPAASAIGPGTTRAPKAKAAAKSKPKASDVKSVAKSATKPAAAPIATGSIKPNVKPAP